MNEEIDNYTQIVSSLPDLRLPAAFVDDAGVSYHPLMLLAVMFYGKAAGFRTAEELSHGCSTAPDLRYLCSGQHPRASTFTDFRAQWAREIEAGYRLILDGLRKRGVQRIGKMEVPLVHSDQVARQMLLADAAPAAAQPASRARAIELETLTPYAARETAPGSYDPLQVEVPEPVEEARPEPVDVGPSPREQLRKRRRIEMLVAMLVLVTIVGGVTFAYMTRWHLDEDARQAVRMWVAAEYAARELAELKPTWFDPTKERLAPRIVDKALAQKNVEVLSISSRGRGDEIAVRVEVAVVGEQPRDGRGVRYYSLIRDPVHGWRMNTEMTAFSYYTRL